MQINPLLFDTSRIAAARGDFTSPIVEIPSGDSPDAVPRGVKSREREFRRRERMNEDALAPSSVAATIAAAPPKSAETLLRAEREVAPGSRASERTFQQSDQRARIASDNQGFRDALEKATEKQRPPQQADVRNTSKSPTAQTGDAKAAASSDLAESPQKSSSPRAQSNGLTLGTSALESQRAANPSITAPAKSPSITPLPHSGNPGANSASNRTIGPVPAATAAASGPQRFAAPAVLASARSAAATTSPPASATIAEAAPSPTHAQRASTTKPARIAEMRSEEPNFDPLLRFVRSNLDREHSSASLRLDPPDLGVVRVFLEVRRDVVALRIEPESAAAHQLLTDSADALRTTLERAGLHVEQLEVRIAPPPEAPLAPSDAGTSFRPDDGPSGDESFTDERTSRNRGPSRMHPATLEEDQPRYTGGLSLLA